MEIHSGVLAIHCSQASAGQRRGRQPDVRGGPWGGQTQELRGKGQSLKDAAVVRGGKRPGKRAVQLGRSHGALHGTWTTPL